MFIFPSGEVCVFWAVFRLEPYADPYYDYDIERFWRGGHYENFRVQYTETEPYHSYRVSGPRGASDGPGRACRPGGPASSPD